MGKQSLTQNRTAHFDWLTQEVYQWNKLINYCISCEILVLIQITGIPQKKWSSHHGQQNSSKCSTWMQCQKWQNDLCFQGKLFNITVIQVYSLTSNAEEAEVERFYEDLQDLLELTPPKRCTFHYRGLECKSRKSRDTWSNRQIWSWSTKRSSAKTNRVLPREHTGPSKHPLPTT